MGKYLLCLTASVAIMSATLTGTVETVRAQEAPEPPQNTTEDLDIAAVSASVLFGLSEDVRGSLFIAGFSEIDTRLLQIDLTHRLTENFYLGGTYILLSADDATNQNTIRTHLDYRMRWSSFGFDARNSLEYRTPDGDVEERLRVRSRLRLTYFGGFGDMRYSAYAAVEPHYDFTDNELSRANYHVGIRPAVTDTVSVDLSVLRADSFDGIDINILSVSLILNLN